jgi:hypothetical protein
MLICCVRCRRVIDFDELIETTKSNQVFLLESKKNVLLSMRNANGMCMTVMRTRPIDVICYVPLSADAVNVRTCRTAHDTLRDEESKVSAVVYEVSLNGVKYPTHPPTTRATTLPFRYGASMPRYFVLITHLHF